MAEEAYIDRFRRLAEPAGHVPLGIGDDAAEILLEGTAVASCDLVVEDVHFRPAHSTPEDVGHKAAAVALSDLAAMGARPRALLVALALGPGHPDAARMHVGLSSVGAAHGAPVVGGDVSSAAVTSLAVTALGDLPADRPAVRRSGAEPGDRVWITGPVGGSAAGLALLEGSITAGPDSGDGEGLIARHLRPEPRIAAGEALAAAGARAMIDVSDGLALDAERLGRASGVHLEIDAGSAPRQQGVDAVAQALEVDPATFACTGGEDYELLVCGPSDLPSRAGIALEEIGEARSGSGATLTADGEALDLGDGGWLHAV